MGGARVSMAGLQVVGDTCWWSESRPHEGGRMVVMRLEAGGTPEEISPPAVSVRGRIHEYGGGAHFADADGLLYTDLDDQALWSLVPGQQSVRLTPPAPAGETHRYGDARPVAGGRFVVSLRERHHGHAVDDEVVVLDRTGALAPAVLVAGPDFLAAPRPSPDGRHLAWLAWNHPNMPWDGTELWTAELEQPGPQSVSGPRLGTPVLVAGGPDESVGQPRWDGDDLWFVSDRFGWWQPYRRRPGEEPARMATTEVEFASADWNLGQSTITVGSHGQLLCRIRSGGRDQVAVVDPDSGVLEILDQPCVTISAVADAGDAVVVLGSSATAPTALYRVTPGAGGAAPVTEELYRPMASPLEADWVSVPEEFSFTTAAGVPASLLFFAPHAPGWAGPEATLPPLVVVCHAGPTAGVEPGFDAGVQLWTSRGVAVALVDYRGSTGHGRAFRRLLDGAWGEADAEDCRVAATFLAEAGLVDGERMVAKGTSAGGLTALRCLDVGGPFAAAVVAYAVTDLEALAADTHKFESRYIDGLVGPWPAAASVYEERSPARHPERMAGSVLLLQGSDDPIVPPDQAERLAEALRARGQRCDHVVFDGEGHGFRRADTLTRSAELEIAFVIDVLGLAGPA
jgi:dipeptidyl aminopeptidase/acylaminoacyl peptidase